MSRPLLEEIEREERKRVKLKVRELGAVSPIKAIVGAFVVAPFAWTCLLFIPLLGLILVGMAMVITVRYMVMIGSPLLALLIISSSLLSTITAGALFSAFVQRSDLLFYFMAGFSVAIVTTYIVSISGSIWLHYERAASDEHR